MRRSYFIFALVGLATLSSLIGCGGSGASALPDLTQSQVKAILSRGMNLSRTAPQPNNNPAEIHRKAVSAPNTPKDPDPDSLYFDEELQLWVADDLVTPNTTYFFEDQAMTLPAGSDVTVEDPTHLFGLKRHFEVTKGPRAGEVFDSLYFLHEGGGGQEDITGKTKDGKFESHATWPEGGLVSYSERWDMNDGAWFTFTNAPIIEGGHLVEFKSSAGVNATWTFNGDLSGTATITGPSAGLPATMAWDDTGNGQITWADGSIEAYNVWS